MYEDMIQMFCVNRLPVVTESTKTYSILVILHGR